MDGGIWQFPAGISGSTERIWISNARTAGQFSAGLFTPGADQYNDFSESANGRKRTIPIYMGSAQWNYHSLDKTSMPDYLNSLIINVIRKHKIYQDDLNKLKPLDSNSCKNI